jgi:hypothetical protein
MNAGKIKIYLFFKFHMITYLIFLKKTYFYILYLRTREIK